MQPPGRDEQVHEERHEGQHRRRLDRRLDGDARAELLAYADAVAPGDGGGEDDTHETEQDALQGC